MLFTLILENQEKRRSNSNKLMHKKATTSLTSTEAKCLKFNRLHPEYSHFYPIYSHFNFQNGQYKPNSSLRCCHYVEILNLKFSCLVAYNNTYKQLDPVIRFLFLMHDCHNDDLICVYTIQNKIREPATINSPIFL